jgi:16S rRNA G966 N2-methylase RsmD
VVQVLQTDALHWLGSRPTADPQERFDVVFLDPPYPSTRCSAVWTRCRRCSLTALVSTSKTTRHWSRPTVGRYCATIAPAASFTVC